MDFSVVDSPLKNQYYGFILVFSCLLQTKKQKKRTTEEVISTSSPFALAKLYNTGGNYG
jgi:hypothetical protein